MNKAKLLQWAASTRLRLSKGKILNPDIPKTKQSIFDAVLAELIALDEYEWGISQETVDAYQAIREQFAEAENGRKPKAGAQGNT